MKIYTLIFYFFFTIGTCLGQQNLIDSLTTSLENTRDTARLYTLIRLCWYELNIAPEKSVEHGLEAVELAKTMKYPLGEGMALNNLGIAYMRRKEHVKAITTYQRALHIQDSLGETHKTARLLTNLGILYGEVEDYKKAIELQQRAFRIKQQLGDTAGVISDLINLGKINHKKGNDKIAMDYYQQALERVQHVNIPHFKASVYNHIGSLKNKQEQYADALENYLKALEVASENSNLREVANCLNNIGVVYRNKNEYLTALGYLQQSDSIYKTLNVKDVNVKLNISRCYFHLNNLETALSIVPKPTSDIHNLEELSEIHTWLSTVYTRKNENKKALFHQKQYARIKDSLFRKEQTRQIALMQARFDLDLKEEKIENQNERISVMQQKERADKNLRIALITVAILLVLLLGLYYNRYRLKKQSAHVLEVKNEVIGKKNEEIAIANKELEKRMLRAQMDPHFIFNSLNSIQHFIMKNDRTSAMNYLSKFSKLIRQMLENSINVSVPIIDEIKLLEIYLELESLRFTNSFDYHITVDESLDVYNIEIPFLLIQPYVENAIAHGLMHKEGNGKLDISLNGEEGCVHCAIEDNGVGREKAQEIKSRKKTVHKSRAMSVTAQRLELINRNQDKKTAISITDLFNEDNSPAGTLVNITIPV